MRCPNCGAPISRRERRCSYCGWENDRYRPPGAKVMALLARGKEAHGQGRYADAVEALAKALEEDPEVFDAYFYLADAWAHLGMLDRAAESMEGAARLRPGSAVVPFNRGTIEASRGHAEAARRFLEQARELAATDPLLADRQAFLGRVQDELRKLG